MGRPVLLDLFCGAGGCAVGYHRAGFDVVGVDVNPQPRYPFEFHRGDAIEFLVLHWNEFDAIHASPPCQHYSRCQNLQNNRNAHPDLVGTVRGLLSDRPKPWVIENVLGAPMEGFVVVLCGLMFDLRVLRHRLFESSVLLMAPPHPKHPKHLRTGTRARRQKGQRSGYSDGKMGLVSVAGNNFNAAAGARAMGIDWMNRKELANAIPPAYTEYLGRQLVGQLG